MVRAMCVETTATRHVAGCLRGDRPMKLLSAFSQQSSRCWTLGCEHRCDVASKALSCGLHGRERRITLRRNVQPPLPLTARYRVSFTTSNLNATVRPNDSQCVRWISNLANILPPLVGSPPLPPTLAKLRRIPRRISSSTRIHKLGSRNQTTRFPMAGFPMAAKAPRSLTACRVAP
jgi:hypothetical protein